MHTIGSAWGQTIQRSAASDHRVIDQLGVGPDTLAPMDGGHALGVPEAKGFLGVCTAGRGTQLVVVEVVEADVFYKERLALHSSCSAVHGHRDPCTDRGITASKP